MYRRDSDKFSLESKFPCKINGYVLDISLQIFLDYISPNKDIYSYLKNGGYVICKMAQYECFARKDQNTLEFTIQDDCKNEVGKLTVAHAQNPARFMSCGEYQVSFPLSFEELIPYVKKSDETRLKVDYNTTSSKKAYEYLRMFTRGSNDTGSNDTGSNDTGSVLFLPCGHSCTSVKLGEDIIRASVLRYREKAELYLKTMPATLKYVFKIAIGGVSATATVYISGISVEIPQMLTVVDKDGSFFKHQFFPTFFNEAVLKEKVFDQKNAGTNYALKATDIENRTITFGQENLSFILQGVLKFESQEDFNNFMKKMLESPNVSSIPITPQDIAEYINDLSFFGIKINTL